MSLKPLRNGKGVNKPFRSPFANVNKTKSDSSTGTSKISQNNTEKSSTSKQLLFEEASPSKQIKLEGISTDGVSSADNDTPCLENYEELKRRVEQKEKAVSDLKRRLVLRKKHDPDDLKADIEKWTAVCQEALRDYQKLLNKRSSERVDMMKILSHLGIPHHIVRYSEEDDTFN